MKHGATCHCVMCTVGKKMGMIKNDHNDGEHNGDQHDDSRDHDDHQENACKNCGHAHGADGNCDCGCK